MVIIIIIYLELMLSACIHIHLLAMQKRSLNNNSNTYDVIYRAVFMAQSHYESWPGSPDKCRLSARSLPTRGPSQTTWAASLAVGCYYPHPPSPLLLLLSQSWYSFAILRRVEDLVDVGTAVKVHSPCSVEQGPRLYIAVAFVVNTTVSSEIRTWVLWHCSWMC